MFDVISLLVLLIIFLYLGWALRDGLKTIREGREKREKEVYGAILDWIGDPSEEKEFRIQSLIDMEKMERDNNEHRLFRLPRL